MKSYEKTDLQNLGPHSAARCLIFSTRSTNFPTRCRSADSNCSFLLITSTMALCSSGSKGPAGFTELHPVCNLKEKNKNQLLYNNVQPVNRFFFIQKLMCV